MKFEKNFTTGILSAIFGTLVLVVIMGFTAPEPSIYSITKKTSYDGITVYGYGDHIIVKTDNSISITK
jgi:hypothetical protein